MGNIKHPSFNYITNYSDQGQNNSTLSVLRATPLHALSALFEADIQELYLCDLCPMRKCGVKRIAALVQLLKIQRAV